MKGSKVFCKLKDPPGYDTHCALKSSVIMFSVYLSCVEQAAAC